MRTVLLGRGRWRRGAVRAVGVLAAAVAAASFVPAALAVSGELRVVYVLATWSQSPFTTAEAERVAVETDAFFRASSAGRFAMPGTVAGPIRLPRSLFDPCDATALRGGAPASVFVGFDRAVMVAPFVGACPFAGEANPTEVLLNGQLSRDLAAHELGHTLGLQHASRWDCTAAGCSIDEYGNEFSVMGGGSGDFNAYEKASLGWLTSVVRPTGDASHEIGPIEGGTTLPQALVVTSATGEFWFESRGKPTQSFAGDSVQPPGVVVVAGPPPGGDASPYPRANLLLPNPNGGSHYAYEAGEAFVQPGGFSVTVERHTADSAMLRFQWLDRTSPLAARVRARATSRGRVRLTWFRARDRGSGVKTYTLLMDGRTVRIVGGEEPLVVWNATLRASRGVHRVSVVATDRAGNQGRPATVRVRVR